jgi:hypothetical protein
MRELQAPQQRGVRLTPHRIQVRRSQSIPDPQGRRRFPVSVSRRHTSSSVNGRAVREPRHARFAILCVALSVFPE